MQYLPNAHYGGPRGSVQYGMGQQLLERHRKNIFLDTVKGAGCVDQYVEVSKQDIKVSYTPPSY